jgi:hypothetical protein
MTALTRLQRVRMRRIFLKTQNLVLFNFLWAFTFGLTLLVLLSR